MNVKEALEWSKEHGGRAVDRAHPSPSFGWRGWLAWSSEDYVYKLTFEDLVADDWEPVGEPG